MMLKMQLFLLLLICCTFWTTVSGARNWWLLALPSSPESIVDPNNYKSYCKRLPYLVKRQQEICDLDYNVLQTVNRGAKLGLEECQHQFRTSRWNCTSNQITNSTTFGGILSSQNREKSYLYASSAAGVAWAATKACSLGQLPECGCDNRIKNRNTRGRWEWGGCSDDIRSGSQFSKDFVDSGEDPTTPQGVINLHNNEAGRRVIRSNMDLVCKCHGVSGSCTIRVCWRKMKPFRAIGDELSKKFDAATKVRVLDGKTGRIKLRPTKREIKRPGKMDLIFLEDSPDFCQPDQMFVNVCLGCMNNRLFSCSIGVLGTQGRECNSTSYGMDGCRLLCCGRGYTTIIQEVAEKCDCKFVWCCKIECKSCITKREVNVCN